MDDLVLFVKVAKLGGFINTARAIHVSHTTISRRIKGLEDALDVKLFNKSPHYFQLTEKGQQIYNMLASEVESQDDLIYRVKTLVASNKEPEGSLNIMLPPVVATYFVTPRVIEFITKYPKLRLNFMYASFHNLSLLSNNADIGIVPNIPIQQTQKIKKLFSDEFVIVCTSAYAQQYGVPQSPLELNKHLVALTHSPGDSFNSNKEFVFTNKQTGEVVPAQINPRLTSDNTLQAIQYLHSNMVVVPMHSSVAAVISQKTKLVRVLPEWSFHNVTYYLLKNNFSNTVNVDLFSDFLVEIVNDVISKNLDIFA